MYSISGKIKITLSSGAENKDEYLENEYMGEAMRIYDISKELFSTIVYPGDPVSSVTRVKSIEQGDVCNLSLLSIGSHSGTHMDAPKHFVDNGKATDEMELSKCVGECKVVTVEGDITATLIHEMGSTGVKKLLMKGDATLTVEAAEALVHMGFDCIGVEKMTVGTELTGPEVHQILLRSEVVIIENLDMKDVMDGEYFLVSLPLKMEGLDGSPCRAILMEE